MSNTLHLEALPTHRLHPAKSPTLSSNSNPNSNSKSNSSYLRHTSTSSNYYRYRRYPLVTASYQPTMVLVTTLETVPSREPPGNSPTSPTYATTGTTAEVKRTSSISSSLRRAYSRSRQSMLAAGPITSPAVLSKALLRTPSSASSHSVSASTSVPPNSTSFSTPLTKTVSTTSYRTVEHEVDQPIVRRPRRPSDATIESTNQFLIETRATVLATTDGTPSTRRRPSESSSARRLPSRANPANASYHGAHQQLIPVQSQPATPKAPPPMNAVWLDDEDEDDQDAKTMQGRKAKSIATLRKWSSKRALSSMDSSNSPANNSPNTRSGSFSSHRHSRLMPSSSAIPRSPSSPDSVATTARSTARPRNNGSPIIARPTSVFTLSSRTHYSPPSASSKNHQRSRSSASRILNFWASPSKQRQHQKTFSKDMISLPCNFVHTQHVDAGGVVGPIKEVNGIPLAPPSNRDNFKRDSSGSGQTSLSFSSFSSNSSRSNSRKGGQGGTANAAAAHSNASSQASHISQASQASTISSNRRGSGGITTSTPATSATGSPTVPKDGSDSFCSWNMPTADFVEQQKWLHAHLGEVDSPTTSIITAKQQRTPSSTSSMMYSPCSPVLPAERRSALLPSPTMNGGPAFAYTTALGIRTDLQDVKEDVGEDEEHAPWI